MPTSGRASQRHCSVRLDSNSSFELQASRGRQNDRRLQRKASASRFGKIAPWTVHTITAVSSRSERLTGGGLGIDFRKKLRNRARFHQRRARRVAHKIMNYTLLPEADLGLGRMNIDIDLRSRHFEEQQNHRKNRRRQNIAVSVGESRVGLAGRGSVGHSRK